MKASVLATLEPLLSVLRSHPALDEVHPGEFRLRGQDFVHFHEEDGGVVADVLLATGRVHRPATTPVDQADLLERIGHVLDSLEARERSRGRRRRADRTDSDR